MAQIIEKCNKKILTFYFRTFDFYTLQSARVKQLVFSRTWKYWTSNLTKLQKPNLEPTEPPVCSLEPNLEPTEPPKNRTEPRTLLNRMAKMDDFFGDFFIKTEPRTCWTSNLSSKTEPRTYRTSKKPNWTSNRARFDPTLTRALFFQLSYMCALSIKFPELNSWNPMQVVH